MAAVKYTQIATGQWRAGDGNLNHNILALGSDGNVYQYYKSEQMWYPLGRKIAAKPKTYKRMPPVSEEDPF